MTNSSNSTATPAPSQVYRPIALKIAPFRPQHSKWLAPLRAWCVSIGLRVMLSRGYVVFLIGRCRSGKTYLLKRTTPRKIIDGADGWKEKGGAFRFDSCALPVGVFSIDELTGFNAASLRDWVENLSGDRAFILAAQTMSDFDDRGLGQLLNSMGRKVLVVEITSGMQ